VDAGKPGKLTGLLSPLSNLALFQIWRPEHTGWYYSAVKEGQRILDRLSVNAIFSSFPPPGPHFVAAKLQQKTGIPWIAEFRDPWSFSSYTHYDRFTRTIARLIEKRTIRRSKLLVAVSKTMAQKLMTLHSKGTNVIHNGFDEEDYQGDVPLLPKFTITYTGNIYRGKRDPSTLFEAVRQLRHDGKLRSGNLQIRFFGSNLQRTISPLIEKYGLQDLVKICDNIPFRESIKKQRESTVLLSLSWNNINDNYTHPGKLLEYLGAQRPILSTGYKDGIAHDLLRESGSGVLANSVEEMKHVLSQWLEEWKQSGKIISYWQPNTNAIKKYTHKESTRKLAQVLKEAIE